MKQTLVYITCDGPGRAYNDEPCHMRNDTEIMEVLRGETYKYKTKIVEYKGKDYCESCYRDVTLAEQGLRKCVYCTNGKKTKVKGMPANWSPGYYDKISKEDWETYECPDCMGAGTKPL